MSLSLARASTLFYLSSRYFSAKVRCLTLCGTFGAFGGSIVSLGGQYAKWTPRQSMSSLFPKSNSLLALIAREPRLLAAADPTVGSLARYIFLSSAAPSLLWTRPEIRKMIVCATSVKP